MEQLNGKLIRYTHPASPPFKIELNKIYSIVYENKKLFISNEDYKQEIKIDLLKQLFSLLDGDWDELLKEDIKSEIKVSISRAEEKNNKD